MTKIILSIDGMTCSACSSGLEKYLNKQAGILNASVNLVLSTATIEYDEKTLNLKDLDAFIKEAGFTSLGEFKELTLTTQNQKDRYLFIIFTILALLIMYISMGHMLKLPIIPFFNPHTHKITYMFSLFLLATCFLVYGFDILKSGYKNLIHKTPNMDTLVSLGVITSFLYSLYNMFLTLFTSNNAIMNLYFESSAIIIYFLKLGRYLDKSSLNKTKDALKELVTITPVSALLKTNEGEKKVTIDEIQKGDILIAKPGMKIAVDGHILKGSTHLDEAFITGESIPVKKSKNSKVVAGSLNIDGYIEYEAEAIGKDSAISKIVKLVMEASSSTTPISRFADKVSSYFVPLIILLAVTSFLVNLILGASFSKALITFVTVLVVACPCALGLATPLAIIVGVGLSAKNGILIKSSSILETAAHVDTIIFDKTGTLTYGNLRISQINNYSSYSNDELLVLTSSLEAHSTHPIAQAFNYYAKENKLSLKEVTNFINLPGVGLTGTIDNAEIYVGNEKILTKLKIENPYKSSENELTLAGNSLVYVVLNQKIIGLIGVKDIIRNNAQEVIANLKKQNIEVIMLTGDNLNTAKIVAANLGITKIKASMLPEDKTAYIKDLKHQGKTVMMVGDGINDAPSLASASIGVSVSSGTDIAANSSDIILPSDNLAKILTLLKISQETLNKIKQNLFWAFFYNALMLPLALGLFKSITLNPMLASLAMVLSSFTVILNTLRLKRIKL